MTMLHVCVFDDADNTIVEVEILERFLDSLIAHLDALVLCTQL
jgi:hypothetical protein